MNSQWSICLSTTMSLPFKEERHVFLGHCLARLTLQPDSFVNILGNILSYTRIEYGMTFSDAVSLWWQPTQEEPGSVPHVHLGQVSLWADAEGKWRVSLCATQMHSILRSLKGDYYTLPFMGEEQRHFAHSCNNQHWLFTDALNILFPFTVWQWPVL